MSFIHTNTKTFLDSLVDTVKETFTRMCSDNFAYDPTIEARPIKKEKGKMKASGYEHFHLKSYVSYEYFYKSTFDKWLNRPCGSMIIYVKESCAERLLESMGFERHKVVDRARIKKLIGEFCNAMAHSCKHHIEKFTDMELEISEPGSFLDYVPGGIKFPRGQKVYHEVTTYLWGTKPVLVDFTFEK